MTGPVLVGCAHGTRSLEGQQIIRDVLDEVRELVDVEVVEAFVDVQDPRIDDVLDAIAPGEGLTAVVVPILLAGGYHVHVDIASAVARRPDVIAASPLGPDPRLIDIVVQRLSELGTDGSDAIVLAAAGSSDPRSQSDTQAARNMLAARWPGRVELGFAAGVEPRVADVVAELQRDGRTVTVASYLLAKGFFQESLERLSVPVTQALFPHPSAAELIVERYEAVRESWNNDSGLAG